MAVTNVAATIVFPIKDPPIRSPIAGTVGAFSVLSRVYRLACSVVLGESRPWAGWFTDLSGLGSQIIVTADVDFGAIPAQGSQTEAIGTGPTSGIPISPIPPFSSFVFPANPNIAGLIFIANMYTFGKILVRAINYTGGVITPGIISMRFLVIPPIS